MAVDSRYRMSQERKEELERELLYLETDREKEVAEMIKEARSFGDLSENSEYDEAKTEQGKLYSKIAEIKDLIEHAEIISDSQKGKKVGLGTKVTVLLDDETEPETYKIVGSQEANPMEGRISDESPIGRAMLGHQKGAKLSVEVNGTMIHFEIISVDN